MSKNLTVLQVTNYDNIIKAEYQASGFLLDNTTQVRRNVKGNKATFNLIGQGVAQEKISQDDVPLMNPDYSKTEATLTGWNAADYTDIFDQQEVLFDDQRALAKTAGMAIGRRKDQLVIDALSGSGTANVIVDGATNMTYAKFLEIDDLLNNSGVAAASGRRFIAISTAGARSLLQSDKFVSTDFINNRMLNGVGLHGQEVMGYKFIVIPTMIEGGLPKTGDIRTIYAWHEFSTGLATGIDVRTEINYDFRKTSWLVNSMYKAGSVHIDKKGIVKIDIDETK